jgi:hypothetical protein
MHGAGTTTINVPSLKIPPGFRLLTDVVPTLVIVLLLDVLFINPTIRPPASPVNRCMYSPYACSTMIPPYDSIVMNSVVRDLHRLRSAGYASPAPLSTRPYLRAPNITIPAIDRIRGLIDRRYRCYIARRKASLFPLTLL